MSQTDLERLEYRLMAQIRQLQETELLLIEEVTALRLALCFGEAGRQSLLRQKSPLRKALFKPVSEDFQFPELDEDFQFPELTEISEHLKHIEGLTVPGSTSSPRADSSGETGA